MKRSFMKNDFGMYYAQLPSGECVEVTRQECFAPPYISNQRWYWDDEQFTLAVRLAPTEQGKAIGNFHAADIKADERYWDERIGCVYKGTPGCNRDCNFCDACVWAGSDACMDCDSKCEECTLDHISRTVQMDFYWDSDKDNDSPHWESQADSDPYQDCEDAAKVEALEAALAELSDSERELWGYLAEGLSEREIAPLIGLKAHEAVRKRRLKLFSKLTANDGLKGFYGVC
jgi:DNA-binding CsgD family transcriptional regulator